MDYSSFLGDINQLMKRALNSHEALLFSESEPIMATVFEIFFATTCS
jgi:hypothetical protein